MAYLYLPKRCSKNWLRLMGSRRSLMLMPTLLLAASWTDLIRSSLCSNANRCWNDDDDIANEVPRWRKIFAVNFLFKRQSDERTLSLIPVEKKSMQMSSIIKKIGYERWILDSKRPLYPKFTIPWNLDLSNLSGRDFLFVKSGFYLR